MMILEPQIREVERGVEAVLNGEPTLFLVEVRIKPTNNIKVFIDGDQGVSIDKLVQVNRTLYKYIEEKDLYPSGDFSLEVSSPGLDEPLKLNRQYQKNIGREIEVTDKEGTVKEGKLLSASATEIVIEEVKRNEKHVHARKKIEEPIIHTILFDNIKTTKVQARF